MSYGRTIRYLEYLENGEKKRSVGFVKIEAADLLCNIQVQVTGLHPGESCIREVRLQGNGTESVLGTISLHEGKGNLIQRKVPRTKLCEDIDYDSLQSVRIYLGKSRELLCRWREAPAEPAIEERKEELAAEPESEIETQPKAKVQPESEAVPCGELQAAAKAVNPLPTAPAILSGLQDNKWRQLSEIYPHISPFHDERDYLSIGPGDFVILPQRYYRLVTNSFLLHGFYNYGHLILARAMTRGDEVFYLGVPGNYYEKERQVAIMFGFESFECRREPADDGDYGYFMIRVEL